MKRTAILFITVLSTIITFAQKDVQYGKASFYANKFEGRTTASGEKYWHSKLTAAHRTYPFGTKVKVTNLSNGKTIVVRINDRGPFIKDRIIDLSKSGAKQLDFVKAGVTDVKLEIVTRPGEQNTTTSQNSVKPVQNETTAEKPIDIKPRFYELSVKEKKPIGYGVQLASYKEMVNLLDRVKKIEETVDAPISVQVSSVNGVKVYRIIAGQFDTRLKADRFKERIRDAYPGCFIFKY